MFVNVHDRALHKARGRPRLQLHQPLRLDLTHPTKCLLRIISQSPGSSRPLRSNSHSHTQLPAIHFSHLPRSLAASPTATSVAPRDLPYPYPPAATTMPEMSQRAAGLLTSATHNSPDDDEEEERDPHAPSSIPPWVHTNKQSDEESANLLAPPSPSRPNTRHYKPPPTHSYKPGRKWDHLRNAEPPFLSSPITDMQARWTPFMTSSPNFGERRTRQEGRIVGPEWMAENMPDMHPDWRDGDEEEGVQGGRGGMRGLMYKGKWLISPERQERTVRLFWVSTHCCVFQKWIGNWGMGCVWDTARSVGVRQVLFKAFWRIATTRETAYHLAPNQCTNADSLWIHCVPMPPQKPCRCRLDTPSTISSPELRASQHLTANKSNRIHANIPSPAPPPQEPLRPPLLPRRSPRLLRRRPRHRS